MALQVCVFQTILHRLRALNALGVDRMMAVTRSEERMRCAAMTSPRKCGFAAAVKQPRVEIN